MYTTQTILVVADHTADRARLARVLERSEPWKLVWTSDFDDAYDRCMSGTVDTVVIMISMPGRMTLLQRLIRDAPQITRVLVVGGNDEATVLMRFVDQIVTDSLTDGEFREAIARGRLFKRLSAIESFDLLERGIGQLPALPSVYQKLTRALWEPGVHLSRLAAIVETDPVVSVRVLQLTNSAFFGTTRRLASIQEAISRLGVGLLRSLMLTSHVLDTLTPHAREISRERFHAYSLRVARVARKLAAVDSDSAFTAGLLANLGRLVLAVLLPDQFSRIAQRAMETGRSIDLVEIEVLGATHAELGAYLLDRWDLPFGVVEAVGYHHRPAQAYTQETSLLAVTHAADALVGIHWCGDPEDRLDTDYIQRAGMLDKLPGWRVIAQSEE